MSRDKDILRKHLGALEREVMEMLEVVEIDGKYFPLYDKEEFEASLREEAIEQGLEEGREKGLKEGIKEGIKEGSQIKSLEVAQKLKNKNFSYDLISELTGLSIEEIKKI